MASTTLTDPPLPGLHFLLLKDHLGQVSSLPMFSVIRKKKSPASGKMGQWERTLDAKPGDPGSIPGTGMVEGKN